MIVVADASPLRYLIVLGQQDLLPRIFGGSGYHPRCFKELSAPATPILVRNLLADRPRWLEVRDPRTTALQAIAANLDAGERAALALALELKADLVLMDDEEGRGEALTLGIRTTGTIGVLRLAAERGWIDVPAIVTELRRSGFYFSGSLIRSAVGKWL